jgi:hypothetical protein
VAANLAATADGDLSLACCECEPQSRVDDSAGHSIEGYSLAREVSGAEKSAKCYGHQSPCCS